jgi:hypothetical protein
MTNLQLIFAKACNWHAPFNKKYYHYVCDEKIRYKIVYDAPHRIRGVECTEAFDLNMQIFKEHGIPGFKDEEDCMYRSISIDYRHGNYYITYVDKGLKINRYDKWSYFNYKNTFILNKHGMYNMKTKRYLMSTSFTYRQNPFYKEIKERVLRNHPHLEWMWDYKLLSENCCYLSGYSLRYINRFKTFERFNEHYHERREHYETVSKIEQALHMALIWPQDKILIMQDDNLPF